MFSILAQTFLQGIDELVVGPFADTGFLVRGDVGGVKTAKRQLELQTSRVGLTPRYDVTGDTIRRPCQILTFAQCRRFTCIDTERQAADQQYERMLEVIHGALLKQ
ncbi:hypothetical protein D3C85_1212990 [compost metagenome]